MAQERSLEELKLLTLTKNGVRVLFIFYFVIILASLAGTIYALHTYPAAQNKETFALVTGLVMALSGSAIAYSRKLYSACINNTYTFASGSATDGDLADEYRKIGSFAYFFLRPFFGMAFSVVIYAFWRLTISASGANELKFEAGFLYITMTLGFLSGFLAGRVLDMLEGYGARRIEALLGKDD